MLTLWDYLLEIWGQDGHPYVTKETKSTYINTFDSWIDLICQHQPDELTYKRLVELLDEVID